MRPMRRARLWLETCRLWILLVTVPQTLLWSGVNGSGGAWMILGHAALVLLFFVSLDLSYLRVGSDPRLSFERDRFRHDLPLAESARIELSFHRTTCLTKRRGIRYPHPIRVES